VWIVCGGDGDEDNGDGMYVCVLNAVHNCDDRRGIGMEAIL